MRKNRNLLLIFVGIFLLACNQTKKTAVPAPPDYTNPICWYNGFPDTDTAVVDVFYITPTCIFNWIDSSQQTNYHADLYNTKHRKNMGDNAQLGARIFAPTYRYFSPYYRQISIESWTESESVVNERFNLVRQDVQTAFDYYMEHFNNGRPFILAGFSQGAKAVLEIVKGLSPNALQQMVAAYVVGYRITSDELATYPNIRPAQDSLDIGVTICYNSVTTLSVQSPIVSPTAYCINPINWRTDDTPAIMADTLTVRISPTEKVLIVRGMSEASYPKGIPQFATIMKPGNLHLIELSLYEEYLRRNVQQRVSSFYR